MSVATTESVQYMLGKAAVPGSTDTGPTGVTSGTGPWFDVRGQNNLLVTFQSIGTTSGGTILIEETDAIDDSNAATASQLASQAASGFTGTAKLGTHIVLGCGGYVRARISSNITGGGSVIVTLRGN